MPKKSDNFLRGFCRQLREALDEGGELAYEFAELAFEAAELIYTDETGDRDCVDTVGDTDSTQCEAPGETGGGPVSSSESPQSTLPWMVRGDADVQEQLHSSAGVPRGTRSGPSAGLTAQERRHRPKVPLLKGGA